MDTDCNTPDPASRDRPRAWVKLLMLAFLVLVAISILLPALDAAKYAARQMKSTTYVRGMMQSMTAQSHYKYFPGLDHQGDPVDLTVEGRFFLLLDQNYIDADYLVSPLEVKTAWTSGRVTADNYSYALLDISEAGVRRMNWRQPIGPLGMPVLSDRNTGVSGASTDVRSIHPNSEHKWTGNVGYNDGRATLELSHELSTKYLRGRHYESDNLFEMASDDDAMMIYTGE